MVCFYSIYLLIMYFNPRIEAWLYKVTKTKSPEYKSELHASNGKGQAYSQLPEDEAQEQDQGKDEKNDVEKETPDKENESEDKPKEDKDESKDVKGYSGNFCQLSGVKYPNLRFLCPLLLSGGSRKGAQGPSPLIFRPN